MNCLATSLITLACLSVGLLLGVWLQYLLPDHHLSKESQDTVKLGTGMVATMSALVLGLLVSSAKSSFDTMNVAIAQNGGPRDVVNFSVIAFQVFNHHLLLAQ